MQFKDAESDTNRNVFLSTSNADGFKLFTKTVHLPSSVYLFRITVYKYLLQWHDSSNSTGPIMLSVLEHSKAKVWSQPKSHNLDIGINISAIYPNFGISA